MNQCGIVHSMITIAGLKIKLNQVKKGVDYKPRAQLIHALTPTSSPMHTGDIKTREEWNDVLSVHFGIDGTYVNPQRGIQGNQSGILCIKSTEFGRIKYVDDKMVPEKGVIYYETAENTKGLFYERHDNYGMIYAFNSGQKFLVFTGKNSCLKYCGLGQILDIAVFSEAKAAVFKIRVYAQ